MGLTIVSSRDAEVQEFLQALKDERRRAGAAVRNAISAVQADDRSAFGNALPDLDATMTWGRFFRAMRRQAPAGRAIQEAFLDLWVRDGDGLRSEVSNDLILVDGLRKLLPPYEGPTVTLFRGESAWNRRRRTYGLSWTTDLVIAEAFATDRASRYEGGAVLLQAEAAPAAVICVPTHFGIENAEAEYLIDRRLLSCVNVLGRFLPG